MQQGRTPLHLAAENGHVDAVKLLLTSVSTASDLMLIADEVSQAYVLMATRYFFEGVVLLVLTPMSFPRGMRNVVFYCFIGIATSFWPLKKFKTSNGPSSSVFILEKGHLSGSIQNGSTKMSKQSFLNTSPKTWHSKFFFVPSQLCARKKTRELKTTLFLGWDELRSLGLRGISPTLSITATNPEISILLFFCEKPKKIYFDVFGRAVFDRRPKSSFSGMKILEVRVWLFLQLPQVQYSLTISIIIDNMKNNVPFAKKVSVPDERHHAPFKEPSCP